MAEDPFWQSDVQTVGTVTNYEKRIYSEPEAVLYMRSIVFLEVDFVEAMKYVRREVY